MILSEKEANSSGVTPEAKEEDNLEKLLEKVLERRKLLFAEDGQRRRVPFSSNIMKKPLPKKFKMP